MEQSNSLVLSRKLSLDRDNLEEEKRRGTLRNHDSSRRENVQNAQQAQKESRMRPTEPA